MLVSALKEVKSSGEVEIHFRVARDYDWMYTSGGRARSSRTPFPTLLIHMGPSFDEWKSRKSTKKEL